MKYQIESGFVRHFFNQLTLKVLTVSIKSRTSRPPSALLLEITDFFSLGDLFFQMKSKKVLFTCEAVHSFTNNDEDGYTERDRPPALQRRTLPRMDKSLWSQLLKIDLFSLILLEKFRCCLAVRFLDINIPRYLPKYFTDILLILKSSQSCRGRNSHLDIFNLEPDALENWLIKLIILDSWFLSFKKKVVSSANWEI